MSTNTGRQAEMTAAAFLEHKGLKIVAHNWRTRWCEIDLVARQAQCMYFVEVKYRSSAAWGTGLDYITPQKLAQMRFAADFWVARHQWKGEVAISAVEVSGPQMTVTAWLEDL